jgi:hypothetical protein
MHTQIQITMNYLRIFCRALQEPDYGYLFFEPLLLYGVAFGLIALLFGLAVKDSKTQMFGLLFIIASCLTITPYLSQRKASEDRIINIFSLSQPDRAYGFSFNNEDRIKKQWYFWATASIATLTILLGQGDSRTRRPLIAATVGFSILTITYASLAHYEDSKVYHPNLRRELGPSTPPAASLAPPQSRTPP